MNIDMNVILSVLWNMGITSILSGLWTINMCCLFFLTVLLTADKYCFNRQME